MRRLFGAGLVFFALALGALAGPLGGLLADRFKRRPLMIASDIVLGACVLLLLFVHNRGDAWLIYLVAVLYGVVGTVFYPARAALMRVMLPEELLADANGALSIARQGLRVIAPAIGAGLYVAFGHNGGTVAILDSASFAGSALFLLTIRVAEEKPEPPEHHFLREVTKGIDHLWHTLPLRQITVGTTVALLVAGFTETLIFSVLQALGKSPSWFGVLAPLQGAGSIAGGVTAGMVVKKLGETRTVGIGLALFGLCGVLLAVPSLAVVAAAFALAGVGVVWLIVGFTTALQTRTPLAIQGRVSAAADISLSVAQAVSIATGAALSTAVDFRVLLLVMGGVVAASALYLLTRSELMIIAEVVPLGGD
ncbi:MAG TPA: MFS transporter [Gaiellaceae bacterium]|nr:MFS transporter [Gaiellaceae bacterium]